MPLSAEDSAKAVALVEDGRSLRYVVRRLHCTHTAVRKCVQRFRETGRNSRRPGSGKKRKTTAADDRFITLRMLRNRTSTSIEARNQLREVRGVDVSVWTVRRRLAEVGLTACRPAHGPILLPHHRTARLQFANNHLAWTLDQWKAVLFIDESRFCLYSSDGRQRVWRRPGERYTACTFVPRVSHNGGSIMVWAGISFEARTELVFVEGGSLTAHRYITNILEDHVVPFAPVIADNFLLMHDNARPHVARCVNQYLDEVGITCIDWPACSPDMNIIEHAWDMLDKRVRDRAVSPTSLQELRVGLLEEWENIPQDYFRTLFNSLQKRMQAVIRARGGNTRY